MKDKYLLSWKWVNPLVTGRNSFIFQGATAIAFFFPKCEALLPFIPPLYDSLLKILRNTCVLGTWMRYLHAVDHRYNLEIIHLNPELCRKTHFQLPPGDELTSHCSRIIILIRERLRHWFWWQKEIVSKNAVHLWLNLHVTASISFTAHSRLLSWIWAGRGQHGNKSWYVQLLLGVTSEFYAKRKINWKLNISRKTCDSFCVMPLLADLSLRASKCADVLLITFLCVTAHVMMCRWGSLSLWKHTWTGEILVKIGLKRAAVKSDAFHNDTSLLPVIQCRSWLSPEGRSRLWTKSQLTCGKVCPTGWILDLLPQIKAALVSCQPRSFDICQDRRHYSNHGRAALKLTIQSFSWICGWSVCVNRRWTLVLIKRLFLQLHLFF